MFQIDEQLIKAEIIAIGNEITTGLIQESNSTYMSKRLNEEGVDVARVVSIGDVDSDIENVIKEALNRSNIVITTGGLGPTHDDITKPVLTRMFNSESKQDPQVLQDIENFFRNRGRTIPEYSKSQSFVPHNAEILYNEKGTAPGFHFKQNGNSLYVLPGVPLEMRYLFEKYIVTDVQKVGKKKIGHRILNTIGATESKLWEQVGPIESLKDTVKIASLPSHLGIRIRLSATGENESETKEKLDKAELFFQKKVSEFIYGKNDEPLEEIIGRLLLEKNKKLAIAESCTGGLIGHRITNVSGSSKYFLEGMTTYTNEAKTKRLGVPESIIENYGAVSKETAIAMAEGIRKVSGADFALSVTGIAGPSGGTKEKPVGLTYIAISAEWVCECQQFIFPQNREKNKERAAQSALNLLRIELLKENQTH
jgi:nicotinamide-nucleotide amidase